MIAADEYGQTISGSRKGRKITQEMLLASAHITRYSRESTENYLKRVTHLHLQGKKIGRISNLDLCPNLKVLYLYDNQLEKIENVDSIPKLEQLYLNNNQIKEIPELKLETVKKIHLQDNDITFVVGLDSCQKLSELYISNQRLPSYMVLEFDSLSLQAISKSLEVLDVSGNRISLLSQFMMLERLRIFLCDDNRVDDITEVELFVTLPYLQELSLRGNPVCNVPRYRDRIISLSRDSFNKIDGLEVLPNQKIAIKGLVKHRENMMSIAQ